MYALWPHSSSLHNIDRRRRRICLGRRAMINTAGQTNPLIPPYQQNSLYPSRFPPEALLCVARVAETVILE